MTSVRSRVLAWLSPVLVLAAPAPAAPVDQSEADRFTADCLVRLALLDLRTVPEPNADDFAIATDILGVAESLSPADAEIIRRRTEAAWNAGDDDALQACTRRLVELDPTDTVSLLRLITSRMRRLQTIEERLAAYRRFVDESTKLDPSIRSRLALDAALLLRERGDEAGFLDYLKKSAQLDGTNKDAAVLTYTLVAERLDDTARREALANLLYADPLDPHTLTLLAEEMGEAEAFAEALRFHTVSRQINNAAGVQEGIERYIETFALDWRVNGSQKVLDMAVKQLAIDRNRAALSGASRTDPSGFSTLLRPEDVRLGLAFEEVRAGAAMAVNNSIELTASIGDMARTVESESSTLADPLRRPQGMTEEEALARVATMQRQLRLWRLLTGVDADKVEAEAQNEPAPAEGDTWKPIVNAWRLSRAGNHAGALELLDGIGAKGVWADLARGHALRELGRVEDARAAYRSASKDSPFGVLGALAMDQVRALGGTTESAERLAAAKFAQSIPVWIDSMVVNPRNFQVLSVEHERASVSPLARALVRVRIRNLAPIPLGLGSDRAINSRLLFGPTLDGGNYRIGPSPQSEVIELDRRFRLRPGEEVDAYVWPEAGLIGWLTQASAGTSSRIKWRVLQGFETSAYGGPQFQGPGCLEATSSTMMRESLPEASLRPESLGERIRAASEAQLPPLLLAATSVLLNSQAQGLVGDDAAPIVSAIVEKFEAWSPTSRLLCVTLLPPSGQIAELLPLDALIAKDTDPRVLLVGVITRAKAPDDAVITAALANPATSRAAEAHAARLSEGVRTYSISGIPVAEPEAP